MELLTLCLRRTMSYVFKVPKELLTVIPRLNLFIAWVTCCLSTSPQFINRSFAEMKWYFCLCKWSILFEISYMWNGHDFCRWRFQSTYISVPFNAVFIIYKTYLCICTGHKGQSYFKYKIYFECVVNGKDTCFNNLNTLRTECLDD